MTNTEDSVGAPVVAGSLSADRKRHSVNLLVGDMLATEKKDKICLVCGDKALGYNFNAISCESCKAFFRRNAHKTIGGRCEGKCNVNVESRSFCKRCRLTKCFTVGMRKDMILDESQKKLRKQKILINKLRRHGTFPPEDTYAVSEHDIKNTLSQKISPRVTSSFQKQYPYLKDDKITELSNDNDDIPLVEQAEKHRQWKDINDSLFDIVSDMDENDKILIFEMNKAHESSAFLSNTETCLKQVPTNATEVFNIADGIVRRIIKVVKKLNFFRTLSKEDQIALLKGSVVEIMMLRSAVNFDVHTETWTLRTSNCFKCSTSSDTSVTSLPASSASSSESFDFCKLPQGLDIQKLHEAALRGADISALRAAVKEGTFSHLSKMGNGSNSLGKNSVAEGIDNPSGGITISSELLKIGNTETKNRHGLENRSLTEKFQETYADVLRKYIEKRYPDQKNMFARCLMKLTDLRNVNEVHTKMLLKMQMDSIEPLLLEIFDLPQ